MNFSNKLLAGVLALALVAIVGLPALATTSTKRLFDEAELKIEHGTATATMTAAVWTNATTVLTIAPEGQHALQDVRAVFDLDKATTGFGTVFSSATIKFSIARKVDGTNWRISKNLDLSTITGTAAAGQSAELVIGEVAPGEDVRVMITLSAETGNFVMPFLVYYRAGARATITPS